MNPGLAAVMLCAGAAAATDRVPDPALESIVGIQELLVARINGDRLPRILGQIDVYIGDAELEGPLRMSIQPAFPGQTKLSVEIVDMAKPTWDVAAELARAGFDYEHIPDAKWLVSVKVDAGSCPRIERAVASLRDAIVHSLDRFASSPKSPVMMSGVLHARLVEVRIVGPDFEGFSIASQYPGPSALMSHADAVAQIAAGCAHKPVRRMVFDTEPTPNSN